MSEVRLGDWPEWPLDPVRILAVLERHRVACVVIGGVAAIVHGSPLPTYDLDITPAPGRRNRDALYAALVDLDALMLLDDDEDPRPLSGEQALAEERDVSFYTPAGYLDVLFRPAGTRGYGELARNAERVEVAPGLVVAVAALRDVVRSKEALGRERDLAQLAALHTLLELSYVTPLSRRV